MRLAISRTSEAVRRERAKPVASAPALRALNNEVSDHHALKLFIAATVALLSPLLAATAHADCSRECAEDYRSDVNFCQTIAGNDPADYDFSCVQNARDDYHTCVDDCSDPFEISTR